MAAIYSRTIDPQRPDPTPVIKDFINDKDISKLSGLIEALVDSSWKNVEGAQLSELVDRLKSLSSSKRKADFETNLEHVANQVTYLVNLILFNMTSVHALQAFNSMNDIDDRLEFLNLLPMQTRLWIIQSAFNHLDEKQQDAIIPLLTKWIVNKESDIIYEEEVHPAEEPNKVQTIAKWLLELSELNPKLAFIKEMVFNQISTSDDVNFPIALAEFLTQVNDEAVTRFKEAVLIEDMETRLNVRRFELLEDPEALHEELGILAEYLSNLNQLGAEFEPYIHQSIKTIKETIFDTIDDDLAVDLIPIFLQFVKLNEISCLTSDLYKTSYWHSASGDIINPLLQRWLEKGDEHFEFILSCFSNSLKLNLNLEIKAQIAAMTGVVLNPS